MLHTKLKKNTNIKNIEKVKSRNGFIRAVQMEMFILIFIKYYYKYFEVNFDPENP